MQRGSATNGPRSTDDSVDDATQEAGSSKHKTLEEKQAEYALARQRIYGDQDGSVVGSLDERGEGDEAEIRGRTARRYHDEPDPVPRHPFGDPVAVVPAFQPVYPSLYHPPKPEQQHPLVVPPVDQYGGSNFAFPPNGIQHPAYSMQPMPVTNGYLDQMPAGYAGNFQPGRAMYPTHQPYGDHNMPPNSAYISQPPPSAYANQQWQHGISGNENVSSAPQYHPNFLPSQVSMPPMATNGYGWGYPSGMSQMMGSGQPMPMIPQGMQPYQPPYLYPPHQGMYPSLVQPTPMRPNPYPHSSSASSISSRSYHDGSRPHSRGSTTSTRSAASSVRLGAMFPAGEPANYRQKPLKGQGFNGMTGIGMGERRHTRGHSPVSLQPSVSRHDKLILHQSSATTASSRSSRRAASIILNPPAQHQLPQRPDWAANNVPYHPSPMPLQVSQIPAPSTTDFPPLLRIGTNAEPMQVERAKARQNGTVWNGTAVKALQQNPIILQANGGDPSPRPVTIIPPPSRSPAPMPAMDPPTGATEADPDFPRRVPSIRNAGSLYDPSAPRPNSRASSSGHRQRAAASSPTISQTADDIIEAKLAAVSLSAGVIIGPPATKAAPGAPSYAKIVRRD